MIFRIFSKAISSDYFQNFGTEGVADTQGSACFHALPDFHCHSNRDAALYVVLLRTRPAPLTVS